MMPPDPARVVPRTLVEREEFLEHRTQEILLERVLAERERIKTRLGRDGGPLPSWRQEQLFREAREDARKDLDSLLFRYGRDAYDAQLEFELAEADVRASAVKQGAQA